MRFILQLITFTSFFSSLTSCFHRDEGVVTPNYTSRIKSTIDSARIARPEFFERDSQDFADFSEFLIHEDFSFYAIWGKRRGNNYRMNRIIVDEIFYDSSACKAQAFVFLEYNADSLNAPRLYSSFITAGFRNHTDSCLKMYDVNKVYIGLHFRDKEELKYEVYNRWLIWEKMAVCNFGEDYLKEGESNLRSHTLDSPHYWEESLIWKKGIRDKVKYPFQMTQNSSPSHPYEVRQPQFECK